MGRLTINGTTLPEMQVTELDALIQELPGQYKSLFPLRIQFHVAEKHDAELRWREMPALVVKLTPGLRK